MGNLSLKTQNLTDKDQIAHPTFYPYFIDDDGRHWTAEDILSDFLQSNNNALFLLGRPGTGKTTFARTGAYLLNVGVIFQADRELLTRPNFVNDMASLAGSLLNDGEKHTPRHRPPMTFGTFTPQKVQDNGLPEAPRVVWDEEELAAAAGEHIELIPSAAFSMKHMGGDAVVWDSSRSGKYPYVMIVIDEAQLLVCDGSDLRVQETLAAAIDGPLSNKRVKWVFTLNDINAGHINERLARVGRAHDILGFRALNYNESCDVRKALGRPIDDLKQSSRYTIAEILSGENLTKRAAVEGRVQPRFKVNMK